MNTMPRPEHPLPQWERSTWKNLNGEWDFSFDFGKSGVDRKEGLGEKDHRSVLPGKRSERNRL